MEDKMADGALISTVVYGITMPVMLLARPALGWGAASLAERLAPALVQLITPA
jgi:hypothetical protein